MEIKKDIQFIIQKKLMQICFGLFMIKLNFEDEIIIEIADSIEYTKKDSKVQKWNYTSGRKIFSINNLLEIPVKKAVVDIGENLILDFENGDSIMIRAGKDGNESYIIYCKKDFQVIY